MNPSFGRTRQIVTPTCGSITEMDKHTKTYEWGNDCKVNLMFIGPCIILIVE